MGLQIGAENHENSLRKRGRKNNSVWKRILMDFGAFWSSKINGKSTQEEEGENHEKPCFSLVKSMIFSLGPLRKSLILHPEMRTQNGRLRNSKFHRFSDHFGLQNRPEKRRKTEPVSRRYGSHPELVGNRPASEVFGYLSGYSYD